MKGKVVGSIREAVALAGLKDGMTVSFHHHLRNGDYVLNLVMEAVAQLGIRDLTVNASSLFDIHLPLLDHIQNHVVTGIQTDYMSAALGREISRGILERPVEFRTHGGGPATSPRVGPPLTWPLSPPRRRTPWAIAPASTASPPAEAWATPTPTLCTPKR